jgi:hypothetical protein
MGSLFKEAEEASDTKEERGRAVLVLLAALDTQISFLLSDNQPAVRARFELAMSHLQRSIAVDEDLRSKWLTAFEEGESPALLRSVCEGGRKSFSAKGYRYSGL